MAAPAGTIAGVRALADRARALAVGLRLGDDGAALGAPAACWWPRPTAIAQPATQASSCAGGRRPATAAELGLAGDRPAGVLAGDRRQAPAGGGRAALAPAAPGRRRPVGAARWRTRVRDLGADVLRLAPGWPTRFDVVGGESRRGAVVAVRGAARRMLACDAVLLAAEPRPIRNVEGAILTDGGRRDVTSSRSGVEGIRDRAAAGAAIARAWLDAQARRRA